MNLFEESIQLETRHRKLSKELINCITKEMAIQRQLSLIEYKIDLINAEIEEQAKNNNNQED